MKTIKNIIIVCFIVFLMLLFFNHATYRVGYGYPNQEINFLGQTKKEILQKIQSGELPTGFSIDNKLHYFFESDKEMLDNKFLLDLLMSSNIWGVNRKQSGIVIYEQILYFNRKGVVYKQGVKRFYDGP